MSWARPGARGPSGRRFPRWRGPPRPPPEMAALTCVLVVSWITAFLKLSLESALPMVRPGCGQGRAGLSPQAAAPGAAANAMPVPAPADPAASLPPPVKPGLAAPGPPHPRPASLPPSLPPPAAPPPPALHPFIPPRRLSPFPTSACHPRATSPFPSCLPRSAFHPFPLLATAVVPTAPASSPGRARLFSFLLPRHPLLPKLPPPSLLLHPLPYPCIKFLCSHLTASLLFLPLFPFLCPQPLSPGAPSAGTSPVTALSSHPRPFSEPGPKPRWPRGAGRMSGQEPAPVCP